MAIKYKWLTEQLRNIIQRNVEQGIEKMPSENELQSRYRVSRQTVRQSLAILEQEGLIEKRRGSGSYITGLSLDSSKNVIGILISSSTEYIYPGVLSDIHNVLSPEGFREEIFVTGNRTDTERQILLEILASPLRGIIVEGCKSALPNPNLDLYHKLMSKGCHVLFLYNYYQELSPCLYLKDDNLAGSSMLVSHLAEQGHTAIGGIFKYDDRQGIERFQGFAEAMRNNGLAVLDKHISWFGSRQLENLEQQHDTAFLKEIVQNALPSCTAVVCYNDEIAYWLIKELTLAGYTLPEDMALTSFDNTYLSNSDILSITTLLHKPHEMGTRIARMMITKLKGLPVTKQEVPWELVLKGSTSHTADSLDD